MVMEMDPAAAAAAVGEGVAALPGTFPAEDATPDKSMEVSVGDMAPAADVEENGVGDVEEAKEEVGAEAYVAAGVGGAGGFAGLGAVSAGNTTAVGNNSSAAMESVANPLLDKYNEYWKGVRENPSDFLTWTYLLSTVEKLEDLARIREAYDAFLAEYPLCYGYWKKYADAEYRYAGNESACEVYNRGVQSVPYSVDLWCHCVAFQQTNVKAHADEIRRFFEQGLAYVGSDYLSHALWDKYLNFEASEGHVLGQAQLYSRILGCPIKELNRYYQSFKDFVAQYSASDLMTEMEIKTFRAQVEQKKAESKMSGSPQAATAPAPTVSIPNSAPPVPAQDPPVPAKDEPMGEPEGTQEDTMEDVQAESHSAEVENLGDPGNAGEEKGAAQGQETMDVEPCPPGAEAEGVEVSLEEIKEAWVESRCVLLATASEELNRRRPFEECIKRPYFHTKPLDTVQLQAWSKYLDYMESLQDASAETITVYERCLVACACYPEFWKRYIRYMEQSDVERARGILDRATMVHCKLKAEIHLFAAHFEERHGCPDMARERFAHVQTTLAPRLISMIVQYVNFERRQGKLDAACTIYEECIQEELAKETSETCVFLTIQYAHFLGQVVKDHVRGRQVLDKALAQKAVLKALWEGAIHYEECIWKEDSIARICELYEKCVMPPEHTVPGLEEAEREEMSLRYIDFVDMHCDASKWANVEALHAKRFPSVTGTSDSRKRSINSEQEAAPAKSARTSMEAYATMQNVQALQVGTAAVQATPQVPVQAQTYYHTQQQPAAAAQQYAQQYAQYYGYSGYGYTGYGY